MKADALKAIRETVEEIGKKSTRGVAGLPEYFLYWNRSELEWAIVKLWRVAVGVVEAEDKALSSENLGDSITAGAGTTDWKKLPNSEELATNYFQIAISDLIDVYLDQYKKRSGR